MNKTFEPEDDDMQDEYDFSQLQVVKRGSARKQPKPLPKPLTVELAPDVAAMFPDSTAVNEALRFLIRATQQQTSQY